MEFRLGETYGRPAGENPAWIRDALREVHATHGEALITLVLDDGHGTRVSGKLVAVGMGEDWEDDFQSAFLDPLGDSDEPREFPCRELAAFKLWGDGS